jgi:hypothetical protein
MADHELARRMDLNPLLMQARAAWSLRWLWRGLFVAEARMVEWPRCWK